MQVSGSSSLTYRMSSFVSVTWFFSTLLIKSCPISSCYNLTSYSTLCYFIRSLCTDGVTNDLDFYRVSVINGGASGLVGSFYNFLKLAWFLRRSIKDSCLMSVKFAGFKFLISLSEMAIVASLRTLSFSTSLFSIAAKFVSFYNLFFYSYSMSRFSGDNNNGLHKFSIITLMISQWLKYLIFFSKIKRFKLLNTNRNCWLLTVYSNSSNVLNCEYMCRYDCCFIISLASRITVQGPIIATVKCFRGYEGK